MLLSSISVNTAAIITLITLSTYGIISHWWPLLSSWYYCFHLNTATDQAGTLDLIQVTSLGVHVLYNEVGAGWAIFCFNIPSISRIFIQDISFGTLTQCNMTIWLLGRKSPRAVIQKEWRGSKHSCLASCDNLKGIKRGLELEANFREIENPSG